MIAQLKKINGWARIVVIFCIFTFIYIFLSEYFGQPFMPSNPLIKELIFFTYEIITYPFWGLFNYFPKLFVPFFWALNMSLLFGLFALILLQCIKWIIDGFQIK